MPEKTASLEVGHVNWRVRGRTKKRLALASSAGMTVAGPLTEIRDATGGRKEAARSTSSVSEDARHRHALWFAELPSAPWYRATIPRRLAAISYFRPEEPRQDLSAVPRRRQRLSCLLIFLNQPFSALTRIPGLSPRPHSSTTDQHTIACASIESRRKHSTATVLCQILRLTVKNPRHGSLDDGDSTSGRSRSPS